MKNKEIKKYGKYVIGIGVLLVVFFYMFGNLPYAFYSDPIVCTTDVKQCPDGSWVGRVAPNCEFVVCPTSSTSPPCGIIGDVNNDGYITQMDVDFAFSNLETFISADQMKRIDVNGNGRADFNDITILQDYVNGKIITFTSCPITPPPSNDPLMSIYDIINSILNWIRSLFGL